MCQLPVEIKVIANKIDPDFRATALIAAKILKDSHADYCRSIWESMTRSHPQIDWGCDVMLY
jgi:hypothetical protein